MANSADMEALEKECDLKLLPDCIFNKNQILVKMSKFQLSIDSVESLKFLNFDFLKNQNLPFLYKNDIKVKEKWDHKHPKFKNVQI